MRSVDGAAAASGLPEAPEWTAASALPRGRALHGGQLPARVRALLGEEGLHYPDLKTMAGTLCLSVRTLKRKLKQQGCGYRHLLDEVRCRESLRLLGETGLTIEDIGARLGYSTAANFTRAFRRWMGRAPGCYRRQWVRAGYGEAGAERVDVER